MRPYFRLSLLVFVAVSAVAQQATPVKPLFKFQEVMISMRDGVHLHTVILTLTG